jgi:hypothetical protein
MRFTVSLFWLIGNITITTNTYVHTLIYEGDASLLLHHAEVT